MSTIYNPEPAPVMEDFITEYVKRSKPVDANMIVRRLPNGVRRFIESGRPPGEAHESIREFMADRELIKQTRKIGMAGQWVYTKLGKQVAAQLKRRERGNL